jgi:uncharacterized protein
LAVENIREEARSYFEDVAPSHDWHHIERVEKLAETLAEKEDADREVVKLAVLLHDIGRGKEDRGEIENHASWGAEKSGEILAEHSYSKETVEKVKHCIEAHRYSDDIEPETLEAKVLSDADNLDALGASGIARTFCYSGEHGRPVSDTELFPGEDDSESGETGLNHLTNKILTLKQRMYTDSGRKIAEERHDFVKDFVDQMTEEMKGER